MEKERVEVRTRPRPPLPASQQRAVDQFWMERQEEIEATVDFKDRMLPMARLKKVIVRATEDDEDGMMISADTPAFLSKLCELFVQELAVRSWACARSHNRRIILGADIAEAVAATEDGNTFEGDNSAAEMVRAPPPLAASAAGELQTSTVPPAPCYFYSYPVIDDNLDAFALGNTEPSGNTENPAGNADGNVNGAIGVAHGGQQQVLSGNLGNTDPSGTGNESPMHYMLLEEVLLDQDLLFPPDAADMFPDPEDFIIDQDVLHDVFADPSSSSSSTCSN
ncbi:nuclear transcription factor Y subunit C-9-like [Lolium rigidum]|uniref:nuclear transcription factor Y subunit C-9-like n=1 Tax=Lolium rigidum TaxID=89674 RepID=UPI001F5DFA75|nr:nuclear transcription factor Y subunit C-9-like [Lolium rigidum]